MFNNKSINNKESVFSDQVYIAHSKVMADPVTDQPKTEPKEESSPSEETPAQGDGAASSGGVVKSTSWWGVSSLTSYLASPHLLEQGINNVASSMAQVQDFKQRMSRCKSC